MSRLVLAVVSLVALLLFPSLVRADGAVLANARMTDGIAADSQTVTDYTSGATNLFFHVTVATPDAGVTPMRLEQYHMFPGSPLLDLAYDLSGTYAANQDVWLWYGLQKGGAHFPDGQYCIYLKLDGGYTDATASAPVSFAIGAYSPPTCPVNAPVTTNVRIARFHSERRGASLVFRWHVAMPSGIAGFNLYAGGQRINAHLIPVHGRDYRVIERWVPGPYRIGAVPLDRHGHVVP